MEVGNAAFAVSFIFLYITTGQSVSSKLVVNFLCNVQKVKEYQGFWTLIGVLPWQTNSILYIGKFLSEGFVLRYFAAFCVLADFTDLRLISQKHGKSGQIADVCSSQIVVKICGFTTKDFADDYIIAYFSGFA